MTKSPKNPPALSITPNSSAPTTASGGERAKEDGLMQVVGPLPFERRRIPRVATTGRGVMILAGSGSLRKMCGVRYIDTCASGIGVVCEVEVKPGTHFTLYPENGVMPSRSGRVVRCEKSDGGWHLGLQTSQRAVA